MTFRETSDIHGGAAVLVYREGSAQDAGEGMVNGDELLKRQPVTAEHVGNWKNI